MGILMGSEMPELNTFQRRFKQQSSITSMSAFINFLSHSKPKACFTWFDLCLLKAYTIFMVPEIGRAPGKA